MYTRVYGYTMLIPLLIYWVLAKMMLAVNSAPLGNGIFDPLVPSVESSDGYLSNEMALSILRKDISPEKLINREQYEGYIFNQNRCIQFNNRILCGYDKNKGTQLDDYTMLDIGNGCRSRGDRIECGYDNPQFYKNLRRPGVEHGEHEEYYEHNEHDEHDALYENRHHHAGNHHHGGNHHHEGHHHHGDKHQGSLARQAPTRTAMTTNPTIPSIILNRIKTDYLENKLLKNAFDKLVMKAEDTIIGSITTTTDLIKPKIATSSTDTLKPLTSTSTKSTMRKSTLTSKRKKHKSTTSKATTSTTVITTTLATSSESNDISDGETIKRIVKLAPVRKQKRRRLTESLSKLPKLVNKCISDGTVVPPITNNYETTSKGAVLTRTSLEEKVTTACVEQGDRVVCYDFKI